MSRVRVRDEILAPQSAPAIVRHVRVRGSNAEIGQAVAELAISRHGVRPEALLSDGRYARARRSYFRRTYPIQLERMRGVASAFGLRPDDDRFDFSILRLGGSQAAPTNLIGTASYSPPWSTEDRHGRLRRDAVGRMPPDEPLELHLMEWRSEGAPHASIAVHVDDLLSGAIVGINAAGLAVSAVANGAAVDLLDSPGRGSQSVMAIGLHELGLMRFVLDTCRTVDEAQAALLAAHAFPMTSPARYLVADGSGRSFVYELSSDHRTQEIVDGGGDRQVISSFGNDEQPAAWRWRCVVGQDRRSLEVILRPPAVASAGPRGVAEPGSDAPHDRWAETVRIVAAI